MFRKILDPFPLLCGLKNTELSFFRGGSQNDVCLSDKAFFEIMTETIDFDSNKNKPRRLNNKQVRELLSTKAKLTKEQQLLKSVLKKASVFKVISDKSFQNVQEMYEFRRKYKKYIRIKRFVPLTLIAPFRVTIFVENGICYCTWIKINLFNVTGTYRLLFTCLLFFSYVIVLRTRQIKTCLSSL